MDNCTPHLSARVDSRVCEWAAANKVELAYTPLCSSWLNRIEPQFTALRDLALTSTDRASQQEPGNMIRRFISCGDHITDPKLRKVVRRASSKE